MGRPLSFPTGTTVYDPEKCFSGYTVFSHMKEGVILIDMNGKPVHVWRGLDGFPAKMLPGGRVTASRGIRNPTIAYQDQMDLVTCQWDGTVEWEFDHKEFCEDEGIEPRFMAREHHDYQRYGEPLYYVPGAEYGEQPTKTLILTHQDVRKKKISHQLLVDDVLIEVDNDNNIVWEWHAVDHFREIGFDETARNAMFRDPNTQPTGSEGQGDWLHINCASYLGPNKWYDQGDERFHPDNIIMDSREGCFLFIISHQTGKIVWQLGPDYTSTKEARIIGPIIGPHGTHMVPKGMPGEGNILIFDNGGWGGYGAPSQTSKIGLKTMHRDSTRILEINPTTMKIVWQFDAKKLGFPQLFAQHYFYSPLISNAQRLPNGNTLIDMGCDGEFLEVTEEGEVVWSYVSPYVTNTTPGNLYRCYRVPYEWVPQLPKPEEVAMSRVENKDFHLPGAADPAITAEAEVKVSGTVKQDIRAAYCVEKL